MRERKRAGHFAQHAHRFVHGKLATLGNLRSQRLALHVRHGEKRQSFRRARSEERNDMRMLEPCDERDLAFEPVDCDLPCHFRRQHLHDDLSAQRTLGCDEHAGHAATSEFALDGVPVAKRRLKLFAEIAHVAVMRGRLSRVGARSRRSCLWRISALQSRDTLLRLLNARPGDFGRLIKE